MAANSSVSEDLSLDREIEKLDFSVNEKIKYCPFGQLDANENTLILVQDVKDILLLMAAEIKSLNSKVLTLENTIENISMRNRPLKGSV